MDYALGFTLAHELARVVYRWRRWKEDLADQSYEYSVKNLMEYMAKVHAAQWEPCFDIRLMKAELGDAWKTLRWMATMPSANGLVRPLVASWI
jgi:hypothetical protein